MKNKTIKISAFFLKVLLIIFFAIGVFLLILNTWIINTFGYVDFGVIMFTISSPLDTEFLNGQAAMEYKGQLFQILGVVVVCTLVYAFIVLGLNRFLKQAWVKILQSSLMVIAVIVLGLAFYIYNDDYRIAEYFTSKAQQSTYIDDNFVYVKAGDIEFTKGKRNLILIILESVENTFNDPDWFDEPVMPLLQSVQEENLSFRHQYQVKGTGWSVAGITSYLFGAPLIIPFLPKNSNQYKYFLPGAPSLLEVLEAHGYHIILTKGAEANFEGLSRLVRTHSKNAVIQDLSYFRENAPDFENIPNQWKWGLPDEYVYANAKQYLTDLDKSEPFFMMFITVDTHANNRDDCNVYIEPKWNDNRDGFYASDMMAYDFIRWIQAQDFYENTTIVVLGDHLSYLNEIGPVPLAAQAKDDTNYLRDKILSTEFTDYRRDIYNAFINPVITPDYTDTQARVFASFDMAPTILEAMGVTLPQRKFGLGTSLFSAEPTLLEKYGLETYAGEINKRSKVYNSFR